MRSAADFAAAARASGCALVSVDLPRAHFKCSDGWASARLLVALADQSAADPLVVCMARALARRAGGDPAVLGRLIHVFVKERITFARERVETFRGASYLLGRVLARGWWIGDCDCSADLAYAIARAAGLPAKLAFFAKGGQPAHVAAVIGEPARGTGRVRWRWAETTLAAARYGEHPVAAAKRLGVTKRGDLVFDGGGKAMGEASDAGHVGQSMGHVYAARLDVTSDAPTADAIRAALESIGCSNVSVWLDAASVPAAIVRIAGGAPSSEGATSAAWARWTWDGADGAIPVAVEGSAVSFVIGAIGDAGDDGPSGATTLRFTAHVPDRFFAVLVAESARRGIDPLVPLALVNEESNVTAHVINKAGFAGINQMGAEALAGRMTPAEYARLSADEQLPIAFEFWDAQARRYGPDAYDHAGILLALNFLPARNVRGEGLDHVLTRKGEVDEHGKPTRFFESNDTLSSDGETITVGDMFAAITRAQTTRDPHAAERWAELVARLRDAERAAGMGALEKIAIAGVVGVGLGTLLAQIVS